MFEALTVVNSGLITAILVAGGWVKVRDYFRSRSAAKVAELKAKADKAEAEIQARISAALEAAKAEIKDKVE